MNAPAATASELVIGYGSTDVLGPISLTLGSGVTALLGRNGAGKTTLMRTLCGIIPPLQGTCTVLGSPVVDGASIRAQVGYLGHASGLATALTVGQNLRFWAEVVSTYPDVTLVPTPELIERFELSTMLKSPVSSLSRGQRQRVDLARLAMTDPQFLVLDEPLTGLDPIYAAQTRALLRSWGETRAVLYSTHSVPEALALAQHYLVVSGRDLIDLDPGTVTEDAILTALEVTR